VHSEQLTGGARERVDGRLAVPVPFTICGQVIAGEKILSVLSSDVVTGLGTILPTPTTRESHASEVAGGVGTRIPIAPASERHAYELAGIPDRKRRFEVGG